MRYLKILAAALAAASAAPSVAGAPQVEQGLAFLVGEWTIAGAEDRYRDSCTWFDDRSFVVCNTSDGRHGKPQHHVAAIGWSAATGNYTYLAYAQDGASRMETCFLSDKKGLMCLGERHGPDNSFAQTRSHIWPTTTGLGIAQDRSVNGGPWSEVGQVAYIPAKK